MAGCKQISHSVFRDIICILKQSEHRYLCASADELFCYFRDLFKHHINNCKCFIHYSRCCFFSGFYYNAGGSFFADYIIWLIHGLVDLFIVCRSVFYISQLSDNLYGNLSCTFRINRMNQGKCGTHGFFLVYRTIIPCHITGPVYQFLYFPFIFYQIIVFIISTAHLFAPINLNSSVIDQNDFFDRCIITIL